MHITHDSKSCPEIIVPYQKFNGNYLKVLYHPEFPDLVTDSEKKLLKYLNEKGFKNGKCYPRQKTIAWKLGISDKQVRNLTRSLEAKGFLLVEQCNGVARHLFRRTNRYYFLWHSAYEAISAQISAQNVDPSFNKNKSTSPKETRKRIGGGVDNSKEDTTRYQTELDNLCRQISGRTKPAGSRFNPLAFRFKHLKFYGAEAVKNALERILEKLESTRDNSIINIFEWWGLGVDLLKTYKIMNESTCSGWLGEDSKPPDKVSASVMALIPGLVKAF